MPDTTMPKRVLGRTGLEIGVIGLGTEYLTDRENTIAVVREALDHGVNFLDALMPMPAYRDNLGAALAGRRAEAVLACHLGGALKNNQWNITRQPTEAQEFFEDWLRRLRTDYADIVIITCCDKKEEFERIAAPGGVLDLAGRLVQAGKARFIGYSGHKEDIARLAIESGVYDVLIQGCNLNWPVKAVGELCAAQNVGLIGMKPYAGGEFFHPPYNEFTTPVNAIAYVLDQPSITSVIPGVSTPAQLHDALRYLNATAAERDWRPIVDNFSQRLAGTCVYCDHCLPCTAEIPIGQVAKAYRGLGWGMTYAPDMAAGLADKPGRCTGCGICLDRCPFEVDVPAMMAKAAAAFAPYRPDKPPGDDQREV